MTDREKYLFHQVHPLKLFTDWGTGLAGLWFFWKHEFLFGIAFVIVPAVAVSFFMLRFARLEHSAELARGKFVMAHMTRTRESLRFLGYLAMVGGAWYHWPWVMIGGLVVILSAWFAVRPA